MARPSLFVRPLEQGEMEFLAHLRKSRRQASEQLVAGQQGRQPGEPPWQSGPPEPKLTSQNDWIHPDFRSKQTQTEVRRK